jgi:hypothetical protein
MELNMAVLVADEVIVVRIISVMAVVLIWSPRMIRPLRPCGVVAQGVTVGDVDLSLEPGLVVASTAT